MEQEQFRGVIPGVCSITRRVGEFVFLLLPDDDDVAIEYCGRNGGAAGIAIWYGGFGVYAEVKDGRFVRVTLPDKEGREVRVYYRGRSGNSGRLGIQAPRDVVIKRAELMP